jgi:hypothetical protein
MVFFDSLGCVFVEVNVIIWWLSMN